MQTSKRFFWGGVVTLALGVIILFNATFVSSAIAVVTGLFLLVGGAAQIALGFLDDTRDRKWLTVLLGVLTLVLGWVFISNPLAGVFSLTTFLLLLIAASGVVQVIMALRARGTPYFAPFLLAGLVSAVLASILLFSPTATMALLGILLGVHMIEVGVCFIMMGYLTKSLDA